MLSHGNLVAMSMCYLADVDQVHQRDAILYAAPISHGAGLYNFIHVRMAARHVSCKVRASSPMKCSISAARSAMSRCSQRPPWCDVWSMRQKTR